MTPRSRRRTTGAVLSILSVLMSGCASSTPATTSTPASAIATVTQTTSEAPAAATSLAEEERRERAAEAKRQREEKAEEAKQAREEKATEAAQHAKEVAETPKPTPSQRYPEQVEHNIIVACEAHEGTPAACQCGLDRMETNHSLEELIAVEEGERANIPAPAWLQIEAEECKKTYG